MTSVPSILSQLLQECGAHGIRLTLAGDAGLTIDAPKDALTTNMLARLKAYKSELLEALTERAAIMEFDAGLKRHDAERLSCTLLYDMNSTR